MRPIIGIPVSSVNRYSGINCCDNIGMAIKDRIKEARKDAKLTQIELADRSGVKQSTISDLERGVSRGTTSLAQLASALGVSALWLETGKGDRSVKSRQEKVKALAFEPAWGVDSALAAEPALQWVTADESVVLSNYRAATAGWKKAIQDFVMEAEKDPSVRLAEHKL